MAQLQVRRITETHLQLKLSNPAEPVQTHGRAREDVLLALEEAAANGQVIAFRFERKEFEAKVQDQGQSVSKDQVSVSHSGWYYIRERIPNIADEQDLAGNDHIVSLGMLERKKAADFLEAASFLRE